MGQARGQRMVVAVASRIGQVTKLIYRCSWCNKVMRVESTEWQGTAELISHGCCGDCYKKMDIDKTIVPE